MARRGVDGSDWSTDRPARVGPARFNATMSDFIREVDEEYRQDQFRRFLSRHWVALLLLVVVVLVAAGGWRGYGHYRQQRAEAAGARYFDALDAYPTDPKASLAGLDALAQDGPAGYRALARFRSAGELGRTDPPGAIKAFDALAADAAVPQELRDIAALRAGILAVDSADPTELDRRLGPLADTNSPYRSVAREMLAAAAMKRGDDKAAGRWLDAIEADPLASPDSRQRAGSFLAVIRAPKSAPSTDPDGGAGPAVKP